MPELPRANISQAPQSNYRAQSGTRLSGRDPMADATARTGAAITGFADNVAKAQIATEAADAQLKLRDGLDQAYRSLQNEQLDDDQLEAEWMVRSEEVVSGIEGGLGRSPMLQKRWREASAGMVQDYTFKTRTLQRQRQIDGIKAQAVTSMAGVEKRALDPSVPLADFEQDMADLDVMLNNQNATGLYSEVEWAKIQLDRSELLALGKTTRVLHSIDGYMDDGQYKMAEETLFSNWNDLDPTKRQQVKDAIQQKSQIAQAQDQADTLWLQTGEDYGQAMDAAREIENVELRARVEDNLNQRRVQEINARNAGYDEASNTAWTMFDEGTPVNQIPASVWSRMSGKDRAQLRNAERVRANARDDATKRQLDEMSDVSSALLDLAKVQNPEAYKLGPNAWTEQAPELRQLYDNLNQADRIRFHTQYAKAGAESESQAEVTSNYNTVVGLMKIDAPGRYHHRKPDSQMGRRIAMASPTNEDKLPFKNPETGKRESYYDARLYLEGLVYQFTQEWTQANAGQPMDEEAARFIMRQAYKKYSSQMTDTPFRDRMVAAQNAIAALSAEPE